MRQPERGLIHHTDRGGQYASKRYRAVLRRAEMLQSMSSAAGNCYDNAFSESCFGTIKTELELTDYADDPAAVRELSEYVRYYNMERRHSSLEYDTPVEFERRMAGETDQPHRSYRNKRLTCPRKLKHLRPSFIPMLSSDWIERSEVCFPVIHPR